MAQPRRGAWPLAAGAMLALALGMWTGSVEAAAADEYSTESAKASQSLLIDAAHAGKRLVVVGDRGHILFSDDQGKTWTQARVPTRQLLTAVFFSTTSVAGQSAMMRRSSPAPTAARPGASSSKTLPVKPRCSMSPSSTPSTGLP